MVQRKRPIISDRTRDNAKRLRRDMSMPERVLWRILRGRRMCGLRFRRQHPIDPYVVDFYCADASLVIELDGESHVGRYEADQYRTRFLRRMGLRVLRLMNDDVLRHLDAVYDEIERVVLEQLARRERDGASGEDPPLTPPLQGGEA